MVQAQYVRASTSTAKIGTLPVLAMPKHCTSGTSTIHTCKYKYSCITRTRVKQVFCSSCQCHTVQAVQAQYVRASTRALMYNTQAGKVGTLPGLSMPKTPCKRYKHSTYVQAQTLKNTARRLGRPGHILYNARIPVLTTSGTTLGLHMPTAIHTHIRILLALSKPNTVPHVHTQNVAHNFQDKFWPYTPPGREYAAHTQAPYGHCAVRMRTALARTNENARSFTRTRPPQTTRSSKSIGQSW